MVRGLVRPITIRRGLLSLLSFLSASAFSSSKKTRPLPLVVSLSQPTNIHTIIISKNENQKQRRPQQQQQQQDKMLVAKVSLKNLIATSTSQYKGIDPLSNKMHCPFVYHDGYSAVPDWPSKHTFPMMKFEKIANALLTTPTPIISSSSTSTSTRIPLVRSRNDFFSPPNFSELPIEDWLDILYNNDINIEKSTSDDGNRDDDNDDDTRDNNESIDNHGNNNSNNFGYRFLRGELTEEECRKIGFREQTHKTGLIERTFLEIAGTILTAQLALKYGIAANLAGGTHHAHPTGGAGYTILNDLAITSKLLTMAAKAKIKKTVNTTTVIAPNNSMNSIIAKFNEDDKKSDTDYTDIDDVKRVLVIDCDVHQGDGTAQYSTSWKEEGFLFTVSIHCESNYPFQKCNSTYDIGLSDHCNDDEYLKQLKYIVNHAIDEIKPNLILYDAGVDVYKYDKLGRIDLSEEYGIRLRDRFVLDKSVSLGIPIAAVVGGGYDKDIDALARRHAILHEECAYIWRKYKLWKK